MEYKGVKGNWEVIKMDMVDYKQIHIASDAQESVIAGMYLPERKITEELEATAQLMGHSYELLQVLQKLVELKDWKEEKGKDAWYVTVQPATWLKAKELLNKILTPPQTKEDEQHQ